MPGAFRSNPPIKLVKDTQARAVLLRNFQMRGSGRIWDSVAFGPLRELVTFSVSTASAAITSATSNRKRHQHHSARRAPPLVPKLVRAFAATYHELRKWGRYARRSKGAAAGPGPPATPCGRHSGRA